MGRDDGCARKEQTADHFSSFVVADEARNGGGTHGQIYKDECRALTAVSLLSINHFSAWRTKRAGECRAMGITI
jgi:hypothetical protein